MNLNLIGMDISKNIFEVYGVDSLGRKVMRKKLYRSEMGEYFSKLSSVTAVMEACGGAHYWGRELKQYGHEVKLIAPQFVKPFIKTNKSDKADAEAIAEAAQRPNMRFVGVKSIEQQDLQFQHRIRERLVKARTALSNELRGILLEYGITVPAGVRHIRNGLLLAIDPHREKLTKLGWSTICELLDEFHDLEQRISGYDAKIALIAKQSSVAKRLMEVPGIGVLTATAIIAAVGDPHVFKNGRHFAAWLGLVPRHDGTGGKINLLGISRRGDCYLRTLLIHGGRSVGIQCQKYSDRRSLWIKRLRDRTELNRTAVAVANRNARIVWNLLTNPDDVFRRAA